MPPLRCLRLAANKLLEPSVSAARGGGSAPAPPAVAPPLRRRATPPIPRATPPPGGRAPSRWRLRGGSRRAVQAGSRAGSAAAALEPLLRDVHRGLPAPPGRGAVLAGHYLYFHYGCDGVDDRGWGCGYRTLQTLCSWPEARAAGVPALAAVQAALEELGERPRGFRGSRGWIGCVEACLCLERFAGPEARLRHVPPGGLPAQLEPLRAHFAAGGGPVMVGGGGADAGARALLGVSLGPGAEARVLLLDPHCWGAPRSARELQAAGWVGWRRASEAFDPDCFYNLCLTSRRPGPGPEPGPGDGEEPDEEEEQQQPAPAPTIAIQAQ